LQPQHKIWFLLPARAAKRTIGKPTTQEIEKERTRSIMRKTVSVLPTNSQLFQACASDPGNEEAWEEWIRRFTPLLLRSITFAFRRYAAERWPSEDVVRDLVQEIYLAILADDCRLLRRFRGSTDAEAEAYLAHFAINQIVNHLRAAGAQKRHAELVSLDHLEMDDAPDRHLRRTASAATVTALTEAEWVAVMHNVVTEPHRQRNLLLLRLHLFYGCTASEIARAGICTLQESSIANLLSQLKATLKKYLETK
jgi:RNA polymerase sigma factor (sigma-70 family)